MDPMVFREYSTHAVSNLKDLNWDAGVSGPNKASRPSPATRPRRRGPPSLMEVTVKAAAENIDKFELRYLDSIRPGLIMMLHEELGSLPGSISLHAWKVFNMARQRLDYGDKPQRRDQSMVEIKLPSCDQTTNFGMPQASTHSADVLKRALDGSSMVSHRFYHHIPLPTADNFTAYIDPLRPTSSFDFISHIRIAGPCQIKTEELLLLPSLESLGVLEIIAPAEEFSAFPQVSDRILRSWSEDKNAFPRLVILRIYARYHLSEKSLKYLSKFPALAMFEVAGRSEDWQQPERLAMEAGWMCHDQHRATDLPYSSHHRDKTPHSSCAHVTEQLSFPGRFRGLDPGCWACWAYKAIQTKPPRASENAREATAVWAAPDSCRSEVPFASLTLGSDIQTLETARRAMLDMSLIFFWGRSLLDAASPPRARSGGDGSRDSNPFQGGGWPREATTSLAKNARRAASDQHTGGGRPKRRRQVGSIGDVLNSFQI